MVENVAEDKPTFPSSNVPNKHLLKHIPNQCHHAEIVLATDNRVKNKSSKPKSM